VARLLAVALGLLSALVAAGSASAGLQLTTFETGFDEPVHVASNRGEPNRIYVVEQGGLVKIVQNGSTLSTPFLDLRSAVSCCGEQGLLSIAFHPDYPSVRRVYANFTNNAGDTRVVEYRVNAALTQAARSTARVILTIGQPYSNHNGGQLLFGHDHYLYVPTGDGGSAGDPGNRAQRLRSRLGKLLRVNVWTKKAAIVAVGFRNPWRASVDRRTGRIWVGDVGQGWREEIDVFRPASKGLENYGWRRYEGNAVYSGTRLLRRSVYVRPKHVYTHAGGGCAVTGGFVYRGSNIPRIAGRYFFGDYCTGQVWSFKLVGGRRTGFMAHPSLEVSGGLSTFGQGPGGELFVAARDTGRVYRITGT